jgi:hypothetical protein
MKNHIKYSKGICWIGDCRIPYQNGIENEFSESYLKSGHGKSQGNDLILNISGNKRDGVYVNQQGRFTPNLLVCDDMLNDGIIYKSGDGSGNMELININDAHHFSYENPNRKITKMKGVQYNDKGTNSRYYDLDKWFDKVIDSL